jgi:hypothetical protein
MSDVTSFEVTGDWRHIVDDGMVDLDDLPDEALPTGTVKFRPMFPTVATAGVPATAYTFGEVPGLIAGGVLHDLQGRPGVRLAGKVGEHTVRWSAEISLTYQGQKVAYPSPVAFELEADTVLSAIIQQAGRALSPIVLDPRIEALAGRLADVDQVVGQAEQIVEDASQSVIDAKGHADRAEGLAGAQDEHVAGVLEDPQSATHAAFKAVGNATYADRSIRSGLGFAPCVHVEEAPLGTGPLPLRSIDGLLWGNVGATLHKSFDDGQTWTAVATLPGVGSIIDLREAGDGEVLVASNGLWRSTGWSVNPATATWTKVLDTLGGTIRRFSWSVDPVSGWVGLTCYDNGAKRHLSRWAWLSKDHGETFTEIFDMAVAHPTIDQALAHMHTVAIDPYHDGPHPRLWMSYHKTSDDPTNISDPIIRLMWSDDQGATWTRYGTDADRDHPVVAIPTPSGMVFDTDMNPAALRLIDRNMQRRTIHMVRRVGAQMPGWATDWDRDSNGDVHVLFMSAVSGQPGHVISTDGRMTGETLVVEQRPASGQVDGIALAAHRDKMFVTTKQVDLPFDLTVASLPPRGLAPDTLDGLAGGKAVTFSVAAGIGATAYDENTVAIGQVATGGRDAVAVGYGALAPGYSVSIGNGATSSGAGYAVSVGIAATSGENGTAIGANSKAGVGCLSIGRTANTVGATNSTALGAYAVATAAQSTAVGSESVATGTWSTVVGRSAQATGNYADAFGRTAKATHTSAVALGSGTVTSAASQVNVGPRHFAMKKVSSLGNSAVGEINLAAIENASGKLQLLVRGPSGPSTVMWTEP